MTVLNQTKRDLRTIEEIQRDMQRKKADKTSASLTSCTGSQGASGIKAGASNLQPFRATRGTDVGHGKPPRPLLKQLSGHVVADSSHIEASERPKGASRSKSLKGTSNNSSTQSSSLREDVRSAKRHEPRSARKAKTISSEESDVEHYDDHDYYKGNYSKIIGKLFNYDRSRYLSALFLLFLLFQCRFSDNFDDAEVLETDYHAIRREENKRYLL